MTCSIVRSGRGTPAVTTPAVNASAECGVALLAVLFALTLLMLLALPFSVSMSAGADAAAREVDAARAAQASASVRDLLLSEATISHPAFDEDVEYDSRIEWPEGVELPEAMQELAGGGRTQLGGSVEDLQRYLALDSVSPLVLANLLGTAVRLSEALEPDASAMVVDQADALPDEGYLWVAHEVIRYGGKDGNRLIDLERGLFQDLGFVEPKEPYGEHLLVLDYRCVLAVAWPFLGRSDSLAERRPYSSVTELNEIAELGLGRFTQAEMDRFTATLNVSSMAQRAGTWGLPGRVFNGLVAGQSRMIRVKSALHIGSGSTVRLRDLATGAVEYSIVMRASNERAVRDLLLPSVFRLELLRPVTRDFTADETLVEPLIPTPVNINTAGREVLQVLIEDVRREAGVRVHAAGRQRTVPPRPFSRSEARTIADEILASREGDGPYKSWQDLVERVFVPRVVQGSQAERMRYVYLYRNLRTARDSAVEMGTMPICFDSGPWVRYRAGASLKRSRLAPGVAARHERTGIAAAVPGYTLDHSWMTQEQFEKAMRLDRRSPFWITTPINLGSVPPNSPGNDPAGRYNPHLIAHAFPGLGLGAPRYPSRDDVDAGIRPGPAGMRSADWSRERWVQELRRYDSFALALHPRGHEIARDGPYLMQNIGPQDRGGTASPGGNRHDRISFPFSAQFGFMQPFATRFWVEPQSLENVVLFDHSDGDPERNRFAVLARDGNLVLEMIDEAGIDPNPGDSPSGVQRTALEVQVPLPEINLPADTPIHISASAHAGRPHEVALQVDGMPRGRSRYVTYLTAPIDSFDPTQAGNGGALPPQAGNQRYINIQVEDTEGFPPVGVLRIGTELFEYTAINGNSFDCVWNDSIGGRGSRQVAREHAPSIPVDQDGNPTIDIKDLAAQGVNLNVFPSHPAGARVELYGYSNLLTPDSPMMVGETTLGGSVGGFAVARGFLSSNARPLAIALPSGGSFPVGEGIDENWTGDLELADPIQTGDQDPAAGQAAIIDAFPASGGFALLVQMGFGWDFDQGNVTGSTQTGGMEVIRYDSRQGHRLTNIQRAQQLPGDDRTTPTADYDGQPRRFVTRWRPGLLWDPPATEPEFFDVTRAIVWVIPISLPVNSTQVLWDPQQTGFSEWVQLYPNGGDVNDTEWVRYDALSGNNIVRANRVAWERTRFELTRSTGVYRIRINNTGQSNGPGGDLEPWGQVTATSGFIGYTPQIESDYPQIHRARSWLGFRGDMMRDFSQEGANRTSSHAHTNSIVTQCQRLSLQWGNFGAFRGRPGRHDRVALIQGSVASGTQRPNVEWHTVTWAARRFDNDQLANNATPAELLGPWPFQLVAFKNGVQSQYIGPPSNIQNYQDPRNFDRMVKFPSGELPCAWCENVHIGSGVGNAQPVTGFVDEVEVVQHNLPGLVVDQAFTAGAGTFLVQEYMTFDPAGHIVFTNRQVDNWPETGGLVQIDGEILAYRQRTLGEFTVAINGRGLLGTEARDHDRGAHVVFLTQRPVAILGSQVAGRDNVLRVQARGSLPRAGTVRLNQELLHYTWTRVQGDNVTLEMPRWYPSGQAGTSSLARGLFRGRFGTQPGGGSSGEALIEWPFRYWDRHADFSDDPELAYSQLTSTSAPAFFRSIGWREEIRDPLVDVVCMVRTDPRVPWSADATTTPGLWEFTRSGDDDAPRILGAQGARLEVRFSTMYQAGAVDLVTQQAHAWKTSARVSRVRVEYEGEPRIFDEQVTAR
ncbi:MAG: hypothetical protein NXI31_17105 [bacterium]|nr:hypothetical protein [bacterium]